MTKSDSSGLFNRRENSLNIGIGGISYKPNVSPLITRASLHSMHISNPSYSCLLYFTFLT